MRVTRAQSTDGRVLRAVNGGFHETRITAAAPRPQVAPVPGSPVAPSLARILRPQAAYRWLLPQLASITPQYIEMVLRSALAGNHVQQWELFDLMLDSWPELAACAQELTDGVSCLKMIFEPFAEEDEDPTPGAIERCKLASSALRRMAPDAANDENDREGTLNDIIDGWFRGVTCLEIDWHAVSAPGGGTMLAPRSTWWVHPVCFAFDVNGRLGLRVDAQGVLNPSALGTPAGQPAVVGAFPPNKFLIGIHKAKSGTALGGALLRPLAWWWCAANFSADWLLNLAQIFGLPFRWANYDPTAPQETVNAICSMLQNMGSAGWAAFPSGTTLELKDTGKTGDHSPQGELLDRADRYARLLILGQTQSGGKGSAVGGQAFGTVESDVKKKRIEAAGRYACRVFNTQLLPSILTLNYGDADECPAVRLLEDAEGGLDEAQRDAALIAAGVKTSRNFLGKKYGLPPPEDEEDTIGGTTTQSDALPEDDDADTDAARDALAAADGEGHPFHGNQFTGGIPEGEAPPRISVAEADRQLTDGFTETDTNGTTVSFGAELKQKLDRQADGAARKELLGWARDTVRTGKSAVLTVKGEQRTNYGKVYRDAKRRRGFLVIVDTHDGYAFNLHIAKPSKVANRLSGKERANTGEQPPAGVRHPIAAASGASDYGNGNADPVLVNRLGEIAAIDDDAIFTRELRAFADTL